MHKFCTSVFVIAFTISGCANITNRSDGNAVGIDGIACVGTVTSDVAGLVESNNSALLPKVQLQSDKGGVCSAKVFAVTAPVVLYRVFDASKPYTKFGGWWSLKHPAGSRDDYRAANAICKEWSALDMLVSCEIRPGSQIVIGTTQSAVCSDGSRYPKTVENQVFVANDGRAGIIHVGACTEEMIWRQ